MRKRVETEDDGFIHEKVIEPINILLAFLIGIGAILFIMASINSFDLDKTGRIILILATIVVYTVVVVVLLHPKIVLRKIPRDTIIERVETIEKPVIKEVVKVKPIVKYKEKEVIKKVLVPVVVSKTQKEKKKSKYVGSNYTESYHLRDCRFAGVIKPKYLIEEEDKKYFELRGYNACKVCKPDNS